MEICPHYPAVWALAPHPGPDSGEGEKEQEGGTAQFGVDLDRLNGFTLGW